MILRLARVGCFFLSCRTDPSLGTTSREHSNQNPSYTYTKTDKVCFTVFLRCRFCPDYYVSPKQNTAKFRVAKQNTAKFRVAKQNTAKFRVAKGFKAPAN